MRKDINIITDTILGIGALINDITNDLLEGNFNKKEAVEIGKAFDEMKKKTETMEATILLLGGKKKDYFDYENDGFVF